MSKHSHQFVEIYDGLVGFGLDRRTDEKTIVYYLQKISDDTLADVLTKRMEDAELSALFELLSELLRKHLNEDEYHSLFLKENRE
mgnify:CR=1 FL=1